MKEATMATKVKPIPDGYHSVTAYLSIKGAAAALDFYKRALGAELVYKLDMPDGKIGHAEIQIGDSRIMLADENDMPDGITKSPATLGGTTFGIVLYGENVDARFKRAVDAGAKVVRPLSDQFYGDRSGTVQDPYGHLWTLSTHIEDVGPAELRDRMAKMK
jgi:PhnB protein